MAGYKGWESDTDYPEKRGVCEYCGRKDDLKEAFDRVRYICKNASACVLRFRKDRVREDY